LTRCKERLQVSKSQLERDLAALQLDVDTLTSDIGAREADKRRAALDLAALQALVGGTLACRVVEGLWMATLFSSTCMWERPRRLKVVCVAPISCPIGVWL
jgi:hypothetical protein